MSKYKKDELPLYQPGNKETWTSVSDIGKVMHGKMVTVHEYLQVENTFIEGIKAFMTYSKSPHLAIKQLEKPLQLERIKADITKKGFSLESHKKMLDFFLLLEKGLKVNVENMEHVARLALREYIWIQLASESMFVRFDYDYYIDVGTKERCDEAVQKVMDLELSIELWDEPYPLA